MTQPGRAWTVMERKGLFTGIVSVDEQAAKDLSSADPSKPNAFDHAFVVIDEERVAFRVAQATLQLREENERLALENAELRGSSV